MIQTFLSCCRITINCSSSWENLYIYETGDLRKCEYLKRGIHLVSVDHLYFLLSADKTSETTFKPLKIWEVKVDEKYSYYDFTVSKIHLQLTI